jgi:hypothetical protein
MSPKNFDAPVLSFVAAREEQIEQKRRTYERVLFRNVLGVYTVMEQKGLHAIELIDISEQGLSFQLPVDSDYKLDLGEVLNLRLYFASDSFLPVSVKVVRAMDTVIDRIATRQYGCEIDKSLKSYNAVYHLFQFIKSCAEHGHIDSEHLKIFY